MTLLSEGIKELVRHASKPLGVVPRNQFKPLKQQMFQRLLVFGLILIPWFG